MRGAGPGPHVGEQGGELADRDGAEEARAAAAVVGDGLAEFQVGDGGGHLVGQVPLPFRRVAGLQRQIDAHQGVGVGRQRLALRRELHGADAAVIEQQRRLVGGDRAAERVVFAVLRLVLLRHVVLGADEADVLEKVHHL